jgi:hypothetical protein
MMPGFVQMWHAAYIAEELVALVTAVSPEGGKECSVTL